MAVPVYSVAAIYFFLQKKVIDKHICSSKMQQKLQHMCIEQAGLVLPMAQL